MQVFSGETGKPLCYMHPDQIIGRSCWAALKDISLGYFGFSAPFRRIRLAWHHSNDVISFDHPLQVGMEVNLIYLKFRVPVIDDYLSLKEAIRKHDASAVSLLLDSLIDPNICEGEQSVSLLIVAVESKSKDCLDELLEAQADPNARGACPETALCKAARWQGICRYSFVSSLLLYSASVNDYGDLPWTPLHVAVYHKNNDLVLKRLLAHRADPESRTLDDDSTAVLIASKRSNLTALGLLTEAGANLDVVDGKGQNFLNVASGHCAALFNKVLSLTEISSS